MIDVLDGSHGLRDVPEHAAEVVDRAGILSLGVSAAVVIHGGPCFHDQVVDRHAAGNRFRGERILGHADEQVGMKTLVGRSLLYGVGRQPEATAAGVRRAKQFAVHPVQHLRYLGGHDDAAVGSLRREGDEVAIRAGLDAPRHRLERSGAER